MGLPTQLWTRKGGRMEFYCGIDLHSKKSQIAVIDDAMNVLVNKGLANDLGAMLEVLAIIPEKPRIVIESTFNYYWLVDGLQDAGYKVVLAHTLALKRITNAKVKTDRRDAEILARTLRMGEIPEGYIYPRETRGVRDLIRRRTSVVSYRAREYAGLRRLLYFGQCCLTSCLRKILVYIMTPSSSPNSMT
jgi:transposase